MLSLRFYFSFKYLTMSPFGVLSMVPLVIVPMESLVANGSPNGTIFNFINGSIVRALNDIG